MLDPVSITPTPTPTAAVGSAGSASRDQFLRLFVAQLENQNPLDPQSGADMVAQLAQFSSLEQAVETNNRLADMVSSQDAAGSAALADLVGREVTADASTITLDGAPPPLSVATDDTVSGGEVIIRSASGAEIRRVPFGAGASPIAVEWDGRDASGAPLPAGTYSIEVAAHKPDGTAVPARPQVQAVVDAVELTPSGPRLRLGAARISPAAVTVISRPRGVP
jgi:flagellar basal-body rod modification protein FlgD